MKKIPETFKKSEGMKEEFVFLSQRFEKNKEILEPMKAVDGGVEQIEKEAVKGLKLPVYILLMNTYLATKSFAQL